MSPTLTPMQAHERIAEAARKPITETRNVTAIAVGEFARQGDVYLERISSLSKDWTKTGNRQLAPGTSPGSRHVVTKGPTLFVSPELIPRENTRTGVRLLGPQIEAREPFTVEHPEHAHITLPPGLYQASYQLDFQQQQAVRD